MKFHCTKPSRWIATAATVWAVLCCSSCVDSDTFIPFGEFGGPAGVITGTITYAGPPPCTRDGQIVGAAVIYVYDVTQLPPPDGLGKLPAGLGVVTGEQLFRGIRNQLPFDPAGAPICPPATATPVTVSTTWTVSPLPAGVFQVRSFYDYDGDYDPAFGIFSQPSGGDIGGGAVDNVQEVLLGQPVRYRSIALGQVGADGVRSIPPTGALVEGVSVTLALQIPLERPIYYAPEVMDDYYQNTDPNQVVIPADYQLDTFNTTVNPADPNPYANIMATNQSFIRLRLAAGVPALEKDAALANPFFFPVSNPYLLLSYRDENGDGAITEADHIAETDLIPALAPQALMSLMANPATLTSQTGPSVLMQGLVLRESLMDSVPQSPQGPFPDTVPLADRMEARPELVVAMRPAALLIDTTDATCPGVLLVTHQTDKQGMPLITDGAALAASLAARFGRPFEVIVGCLPQGSYAMNLIYDTGQAWTVPNEAGVCDELETPSADGSICGTRPRLASQGITISVGPPTDPNHCAAMCAAAQPRPACLQQTICP